MRNLQLIYLNKTYTMTKKIHYLLLLSTVMFSCSPSENKSVVEDSSTPESEAENEVSNQVTAICIWDKVSVRKEPGAKTTYLTALSIGESLTYLGIDSVIDKKTYSKVLLNDGEEGWSRKDFLVPNAKSAVMISDVSLYSRPDLLTKTDKLFSAMDIVASIEVNGDWMNVKGKRAEGQWLDEGWVKTENVSFDPVDIATAKFAVKALELQGADQVEALRELISNQDLTNSKFMSSLVVKLTKLSESLEQAANETDSISE